MNKILGLGFSPYMNDQNPNYGYQVPVSQIESLIKIAEPYTNWIRTYGADSGLEKIAQIAKGKGLKVAAGSWLSSKYPDVNRRQINNLINIAKSGYADIVVVGNEPILIEGMTPATLIPYIQEVKAAVPSNVQVTTGEAYSTFLNNPNLIDAVDIICAHIYPFWEGVKFDDSIQMVKNKYAELVAKAKGKTVWIGETAWPSGGSAGGNDYTSPERCAKYFSDFIAWARKENINYFYFDFMDEFWKTDGGGADPVGRHWGIFNANANGLKPGMQSVFNG